MVTATRERVVRHPMGNCFDRLVQMGLSYGTTKEIVDSHHSQTS